MSKFVKDAEEINLNLIPIMNLFTALIPFLLMSSVFYKLSIIPVSIPVESESGETDNAKEDDKVTLNVQIAEKYFEVSASSDTLQPSVLAKLKKKIARSPERKPSLEKLKAHALFIKQKYMKSDTAMVVPESDVAYEHVVETLDALRDSPVENGTAASGRLTLFSKVVLSTRIK